MQSNLLLTLLISCYSAHRHNQLHMTLSEKVDVLSPLSFFLESSLLSSSCMSQLYGVGSQNQSRRLLCLYIFDPCVSNIRAGIQKGRILWSHATSARGRIASMITRPTTVIPFSTCDNLHSFSSTPRSKTEPNTRFISACLVNAFLPKRPRLFYSSQTDTCT